MFQTFDDASESDLGAARVEKLRLWLQEQGLDGFVVPRSDEHQGEYVAARSERLKWLTGFSGSAGTALVLADRALLFVDGRYTLQARQQVDPDVFTIESLIDNPPPQWLRENAPEGARIGFDPWLSTIDEARRFRSALGERGGEFVAVAKNPIDMMWDDQPEAPMRPVEIHPIEFAGELAKDKLAQLAADLGRQRATHAVLTDPSSLAWAFNIRGSDIPHTPLALGFALLAADGAHRLYLDERKLAMKVKAYLTQLAELRPPAALEDDVAELARAGARIALDPVLAAEKLNTLVTANGGTVVESADPARIPRATKNAAEIAGARAAHRRDGAALAKMLSWLDRQAPGSADEIGAVTALEEFRRTVGEETQMPLREISFATIAGSGPHGAVIHYRVSRASNRRLGERELFLVDSGGQYQDGTTDITRTVPIGTPSDEMRERYTLVLKGMIRISMLRFPPGTRGSDIDTVARAALWEHGLDYAHGTGHGVGSFLSVHEGPQRIARTGTQKLLAGMIVSNEPGYYKEGQYGIRLENLILVTPEEQIAGGDIAMHGFETLTLVPFDKRMVVTDLLTRDELHWLDAYHARVLAEIGPMLDAETQSWLEQATAPFPKDVKI